MKATFYTLIAFTLGAGSVIGVSHFTRTGERSAFPTYDVWSFVIPVGDDPPNPEFRSSAMWVRAASVAHRKAVARLNAGVPDDARVDLVLALKMNMIEVTVVDPTIGRKRMKAIADVVAEELGEAGRHELEAARKQKPQPGATDNPDDAQRLREDH